MKHLAPSIFREFVCAAGECPDSCCRAGWEIVIDPETLARYEALPGPDGDRIRSAVVPGEEPLLRQDGSRVCVLLDPDGLCHAQKRFGHESLCQVCREYPRFHREFGNLTEHGLSLSCPTAFSLATSGRPGWTEWEDAAPVVPNDLDPARYLPLRESRRLVLDLLTEEDRPLEERLALVWELAERLQRGLDGEKRTGRTACRRLRDPFGRRSVLRRYGLPRRRYGIRLPLEWVRLRNPSRWIDVFAGLEILSPAWREGLEALARRISDLPEADLLSLTADSPERRERCARYLWYSLYKYWLDAADDGLLLPRARRSIVMALLGSAMDALIPQPGSWLQRVSREIEHCEENLEALLR